MYIPPIWWQHIESLSKPFQLGSDMFRFMLTLYDYSIKLILPSLRVLVFDPQHFLRWSAIASKVYMSEVFQIPLADNSRQSRLDTKLTQDGLTVTTDSAVFGIFTTFPQYSERHLHSGLEPTLNRRSEYLRFFQF